VTSRLPGFYRLGVAERRRLLQEAALLPAAGFAAVDPGALSLDVADGMIENVVGTYALPFAVAVNFVIDGAETLVPMAIEEPSVVAAASNAARMARPAGFATHVPSPTMIGQIQITNVVDVDAGAARLHAHARELVDEARALVPRLTERGGGPVSLDARVLARSGPDGGVLVAHLHVDVCDAMGANLVNTLCEALADRIAGLAGGRAGLRILSNLTDGRTVRVRCTIAEPDAEVRAAVAAASRFAELDPYRAATHNKGIMNGVDAVLLATGQDWRAVEAGAHAFAARTGTYRPLATWRETGEAGPPGLTRERSEALRTGERPASRSTGEAGPPGLTGELVMPLAVGTVGGALHLHPGARLAVAMAGADSGGAARLAAIAATAGLATNFAALRALATEGIQRGHMALHARGLARAAGATGDLVDRVAAELAACGDVKAERAREVLARLNEGEPMSRTKELP
jgi:hydroxymethylglutaryl-CoA reductase